MALQQPFSTSDRSPAAGADATRVRPQSAVHGRVPTLSSDRRLVPFAVVSLLTIQAALLAWSATQHSPTILEPAQLAAGVSNWKFREFELFRVNPPLVRMIAALPVLAVGCETDWSSFYLYDAPGSRPEFSVGWDFVEVNGPRSIRLFTLARWACIPITLLGGLFCFLWARELCGRVACGLLALLVWCLEPNILGNGELISTDAAATTFGIGAGYLFWRWLKVPTWNRAMAAGVMLGVAQLSKMSWVFLFILWPLLWVFWRLTAPSVAETEAWPTGDSDVSRDVVRQPMRAPLTQLSLVLLLGLYVLNLGYAFQGTFTRLKEFTFISQSLTGASRAGTPGNRFADSPAGDLPVPLPKQYLLGLDTEKRDFEDYRGEPSYLRGEWKQGGWWYYYLYGLAVKTPHGYQILVALGALGGLTSALRARKAQPDPGRDWWVLCAPPLLLLMIASAQLEFNHYVRYVLPVVGFGAVVAGAAWATGPPFLRTRRLVVGLSVLWCTYALASNYPHQLAYFIEAAGGPVSGHNHLLHDGFDHGQDLFFADRLASSFGNRDDVHILYFGAFWPGDVAIRTNAPVKLPLSPGTYIVSPTYVVHSSDRRALGGPDLEGDLFAALSRYPYRRVDGCAMLVITVPPPSVPPPSERGDPP